MSFRRLLATSPGAVGRAARWAYAAYREASIPAPRLLIRPALHGFVAAREVYYFGMRVLVCEPLFKAYCTEYGEHVHTGSHIHWIRGDGDIILGDHVRFDGRSAIQFAQRFSDRPTLRVGNRSGIGHLCSLTIGKSITIGNDVRIATGVQMFDSPGHPADPDRRRAGQPPADSDVKPIVVEDNVWIGRDAVIVPGVTIGEGSVVAIRAVVTGSVPAYSYVAGNPARIVGTTRPREGEVRPPAPPAPGRG